MRQYLVPGFKFVVLLSATLAMSVLPASPDRGLSVAEARGGGGGGPGGGEGPGGGAGPGNGAGQGQGNAFGQGAAAAARGERGGAEDGHAGGRGGGRGAIASQLGALNAAHASPVARANAAPGSRVGMIAAYERAMIEALALPPGPARDAAILAARETELAAAANRPVTAEVVAAVDALLGLPPTP